MHPGNRSSILLGSKERLRESGVFLLVKNNLYYFGMVTIQRCSTLIKRIKTDRSFGYLKYLKKQCTKAEIYLVGGAVRDALLGRETKDYDFVVCGVPLRTVERALRTLGTVSAVGRTFGVLKFIPRDTSHFESFDIALPRTEASAYHTGHYRDAAVKSDYRLSIHDDLSRRDFTINACALDCASGELIDPFGGVRDMRSKTIRCVGKPHERFAEDYSRMLRAIRFSCQLGFSIEEKTWKSLCRRMTRINALVRATPDLKKIDINTVRIVPYEIIAREWMKSLCADSLQAVRLYDESGAFKALMPEVLKMKGCHQPLEWHNEGDVWAHALLALKTLEKNDFKREFPDALREPILTLTVFFHDIGKPMTIQTPEKDGVDRIRFKGHDRVGAAIAKKIAERLRLGSVEGMNISPDDIYWLIANHLLVLNTHVNELKNTTLEKYFFRDARRGLLLRQLVFADSKASIRADGTSSMGSYRALKKRLHAYERHFHIKNRLPVGLINGDDIMRTFKLKPGKHIGELLLATREEQLAGRVKTKKGALAFLRTIQI